MGSGITASPLLLGMIPKAVREREKYPGFSPSLVLQSAITAYHWLTLPQGKKTRKPSSLQFTVEQRRGRNVSERNQENHWHRAQTHPGSTQALFVELCIYKICILSHLSIYLFISISILYRCIYRDMYICVCCVYIYV